MTYTSPSTINASKGLGEVLSFVNNATDQWLSNLFIFGIWIIILLGYYKAKDDFKGAFAVSSYVTFVSSLFFWLGGFVSGVLFGIVIAVSIISTLVLLLDNNN